MLSLHVDVFKRGPMQSSCLNKYIFWMCSHLGFFSYILSFQVLCVWVSIRFQFILPLFFPFTIRRKRKPGITQPFYLYTIHEHSKMHMIHELRAFVDTQSQMPESHNWHKFIILDLECSPVYIYIYIMLCGLFLPEQSVYCIHFDSFDHESPSDYW